MKQGEHGPVLVDGRNLYDATEMRRIGFRYHGIGRGAERRNGHHVHPTTAAASDSTASASQVK
jgi:hypothetical protein